MNGNQWLIGVGVPSLFVIVFLVWEWRSKRRMRLEQSSPTFDIPDQLPSPHKLERPLR